MGVTVNIERKVTIPDKIKIERYRLVPSLGPKILFFSGGTAIKGMSKNLIEYTHNSIHLITPFDSGGSSAVLRDAFNMISVGDLRNRLMALADQSVKGNPDIYKLFSYRLKEETQDECMHKLNKIIDGQDPLIYVVKNPMKSIIINHLKYFKEEMPREFKLKGASIGNLILAGGYINNANNIDTVLYIFQKLVESRGIVKPIVNDFLHLVTELENGEKLIGQHLLTGKECPSIKSRVKDIYLSKSDEKLDICTTAITEDVKNLIEKADLIIFPMGSFYSSILANLLPNGVSKAIAANPNPKIFIPNTLPDPEQYGMSFEDSLKKLVKTLQKDTNLPVNKFLNFILVDKRNAQYPYESDFSCAEKMGIKTIDTSLVSKESYPYIDSKYLIKVLLSLT